MCRLTSGAVNVSTRSRSKIYRPAVPLSGLSNEMTSSSLNLRPRDLPSRKTGRIPPNRLDLLARLYRPTAMDWAVAPWVIAGQVKEGLAISMYTCSHRVGALSGADPGILESGGVCQVLEKAGP